MTTEENGKPIPITENKQNSKNQDFNLIPNNFFSDVSFKKFFGKKNGAGRVIPSRYICTILGFLVCVIMTTQRLNLTMALEAMVNKTAASQQTDELQKLCPVPRKMNNSRVDEDELYKQNKVFSWSPVTRNNIVSAGFFGFVVTQIPGGRLSETMGAKKILVLSLIIASICTVMSPFAAYRGPYMLLVMQLIKGLSQGMTQPALTCLMSRWLPLPEKGFLSSVIFSGYSAGAVVGGLVSGYLMEAKVLGGWPLAFYIPGVAGLVLSCFVFCLIFNTPEEDSMIKDSELKYILCNIDTEVSEKVKSIPWTPMFLSVRTWALFIGMFGQYWMTFYFLSVYPSFLTSVLHFTNIESGYLNSIPYLGQTAVTWLASYYSDVLVNKRYITISTARKTCNTLSCIGFSLSMAGSIFAGCSQQLNLVWFIISISCVGFGYPGANIVALDMTTTFAGTLMGIAATFASTTGFIIPLIVGALTSKEQTLSQWRSFFHISIIIQVVSGLIFMVFGSAEIQDWDTNEVEKTKSKGADNEAFSECTEKSSQKEPK